MMIGYEWKFGLDVVLCSIWVVTALYLGASVSLLIAFLGVNLVMMIVSYSLGDFAPQKQVRMARHL